jgi:hypothetical protein
MTESSKPLIVADPTKGVKVNAGVVAKPFRDELKAKVEEMKKMGLGTSTDVELVLWKR